MTIYRLIDKFYGNFTKEKSTKNFLRDAEKR